MIGETDLIWTEIWYLHGQQWFIKDPWQLKMSVEFVLIEMHDKMTDVGLVSHCEAASSHAPNLRNPGGLSVFSA